MLRTSSSGTWSAPISRSTLRTASIWPSGSAARRVDNVDEQVGFEHHLERRLERLDQAVGQLGDEPDRVGEQHRLAAGQRELAGGGVERGEEAVLDEHARVGEAVQQRRLAGVGVADERDGGQATAVLGLALRRPVLVDLPELALQLVDAALDAATVDLELGLTRAAGADAATLLAQVVAPAPEAGQAVLELGQLDHGLALLAVGVLGEDVQDHRGAVERRPAEQLLQVVLLGRAELVVEDHGVGVHRQAQLAQLLGLALAHVGGRIRPVAGLHHPADLVGAGRVDQQRQLVEVGVGVVLGRAPAAG